MMLRSPVHLITQTCVALFAGFTLAANLQAQDAGSILLLKPESALKQTSSGSGEATLAPQVDGNTLSFTAPQILIYKKTDPAEFVSAIWKDAAGQPVHQRAVFVVKPDYAVTIDYVYKKAPYVTVRSFTFPPGNVIANEKGAQSAPGNEENLSVQALDPASAELTNSTSGKTIVFTSTVATQAPIASVFAGWTGTAAPKIDYVKPANPMIVKFKVTFPDGRVDQVAVAWEARSLHLSGKEFMGWAACVRQEATGTNSIVIN